MHPRKVYGLAVWLFALLFIAAAADAQTNVRIRGTIAAINGNTLEVKSRDGRSLKIQLADNVAVAVATAVRFDDIKTGDYVGATTRPGPDGIHVAIEVHYLAPTTPEGQLAWDLEPGTTMTNANVGAIVEAVGKRELTLKYKGGEQRIVVPPNAALVKAVPGARADLKVGEYVFIGAQQAADGALSAARVQVSKEGVKPPQ